MIGAGPESEPRHFVGQDERYQGMMVIQKGLAKLDLFGVDQRKTKHTKYRLDSPTEVRTVDALTKVRHKNLLD